MAGGIDWFRWHHGSVTDPKFKLVAKRAGVRIGDVIAFWAMLLEQASLSDVRGVIGSVDFESVDLELDLPDGGSEAIYLAMIDRKLIADGEISSWKKRQVKREREDDNSTERSQKHREKQRQEQTNNGELNDETPRNAMQRQETPREEERREEKNSKPLTNPNGLVVASDADDALPTSDLKSGTCPHQEIIALYHEILPQCPQVREWTPARATQLRARWNEDPTRQNMAYWRRFFEYVKTCDFLVGIQPDARKTPFFADLEWLVKQANFTKIRERKYEPR